MHVFNHDLCCLMCNSDTGHDGHASGMDLNHVVSKVGLVHIQQATHDVTFQ
jgi:hypothetical protein